MCGNNRKKTKKQKTRGIKKYLKNIIKKPLQVHNTML